MTAFNVVRFRVKPGRDQEFLDAHKTIGATWVGLVHANIVKTADRSYCIIAEWKDMDACIQARPNMISTLDSFRDALEDLGGGLGVTDPVSGDAVMRMRALKAATKKKRRPAGARSTKKKTRKKTNRR